MAEYLSLLDINEILTTDRVKEFDAFFLLKSVSSHLNSNSEYLLQEVVLRIIEKKQQFAEYPDIVNDFARRIGLFPYLDPTELNLADKIAYEFHKPEGIGQDNIVFHSAQAKVYLEILEGRNVILSAPTSFGKSLIIDAVIGSGRYQNIVIVLPTIALIDETRKRLSKFREQFKIITHSTQEIQAANIFVLTQERVMEIVKDTPVDFFVIDEFYKIQPTPSDKERSIILNQAFYKLLKKGGQFYLLGPNIENVNMAVFPENLNVSFIKTDYKTVITEKINVRVHNTDEQALLDLCVKLKDPTLIYCASPRSANKVARLLFTSGFFERTSINDDAAEWLKEEYHENWYLPKALQFGIGIHHGKIPRAISQYAVKAFNEGKLNFLICTSTLIEGVNTKAKNVIIYDNKIARDKFDFFTFNNICGRSGRMFQHFIGKVYMFHEPPVEELPLVDFPLFSQPEDVPESLLMQMDNDDLSQRSKEKLKEVNENGMLSLETIKANSNIDPASQINLAVHIKDNARQLYPDLRWNRYPTGQQLKTACLLIWDFLVDAKRMGNVSSGAQLSFKLNRLRAVKDIKDLINIEIGGSTEPEEVNDAIEDTLEFVRFWAQYNFPKYLMALNRIQQEIFGNFRVTYGDYSFFALQIECLFTNPLFVALDEYGVPFQTSDKIKASLDASGNLDLLLSTLRGLNLADLDISEFEKEILKDVKAQI